MAEGGDSVDSGRSQDIPSLSSLTLGSEPVDTPVCKEHGHEFKYFCKSHMVELCLTCRRIDHRKCKTVVDIETAARVIYTEAHGGKVIQSVKQLAERFGKCQGTARAAKGKLHEKRQIVIDSVKRTRKSVEAFLDKLEANALAEIDEILDKETKTLDEQINICNASISFLTASLSSLDRMMSVGNNEDKFVEINRATKQIKQYCSMLNDLGHELRDIDLEFEGNKKVSNLNILLQDLGKCSVVRSSASCDTMETEPIYTGGLQLKTHTGLGDHCSAGDGSQQKYAAYTGDKTPVVFSLDILSDGRHLLIDEANNKLKLYDQNNFLVTEHFLSVKLMRVVILSNTEAVVSTCTNTLLKVTVSDGLAVTEKKSKHIIGPITRCGEDIIAILHGRDSFQVSLLGKDFKIKKTIIKDDDIALFSDPAYLAASVDKRMFFVVDVDNGCFGFTIDGQVRFHYKNREAKEYYGLAVGRDCLFLGVDDEKRDSHIQKLNFRGERLGCADFCRSQPLRIVDNELVLFTVDDKGNPMINFYFLFQ